MLLVDGAWDCRRCFVVGGGPSLRGFPWHRLEGELVVSANLSCPYPTVSVTTDARFVRKMPRGILEKWLTYPGLHVHVNRQLQARVPGVEFVQPCSGWSYSLADGVIAQSNTGLSAVNLADILRATPIYLLGFDMKGEECDTPRGRRALTANWHDAYPAKWRSNACVYETRYIPDFERHARRAVGRIVNLTPGSALTCFEVGRVEDVLK